MQALILIYCLFLSPSLLRSCRDNLIIEENPVENSAESVR